MIETVSRVKRLLNDLKWIFLFFGGSGIITLSNLEFVLKYNLHIPLMILLCHVCIYHVVSLKVSREKRVVEDLIKGQNQTIQQSLKEQEAQRLKASVNTVFSEFKDIEVIDFESSAKYIYELEAKRKELGVNSFTEDKLKRLMDKIKL